LKAIEFGNILPEFHFQNGELRRVPSLISVKESRTIPKSSLTQLRIVHSEHKELTKEIKMPTVYIIIKTNKLKNMEFLNPELGGVVVGRGN
jgi:hypothetical protein